jgi:hypothetical protein
MNQDTEMKHKEVMALKLGLTQPKRNGHQELSWEYVCWCKSESHTVICELIA